MDDTTEEKTPGVKAGTGGPSSRSRATDVPSAKAKEGKPRSGSTKRTKTDAEKPVRKAPAKRKAPAGTKTAAKPATAPKAKTAKAKLASKPRGKAPAKQASAPEVPAHATAPEPEQLPAVRAELPPVQLHDESPDGDIAIHPPPPHSPSAHPHDDGLEFGLSPVDLAPDASVREEAGFGWFVRILASSSVLLVLFNSFAIDKWAREQPVTKLNSQVLIAAHQLHDGMMSIHLDAPLEGMRSIWHNIKAVQWPGSASGPENQKQEKVVSR